MGVLEDVRERVRVAVPDGVRDELRVDEAVDVGSCEAVLDTLSVAAFEEEPVVDAVRVREAVHDAVSEGDCVLDMLELRVTDCEGVETCDGDKLGVCEIDPDTVCDAVTLIDGVPVIDPDCVVLGDKDALADVDCEGDSERVRLGEPELLGVPDAEKVPECDADWVTDGDAVGLAVLDCVRLRVDVPEAVLEAVLLRVPVELGV